jgi:ADP-ribosyl-[dinitrogen reductase] hydrolase
MDISHLNQKQTAMLGALLGDALGCPHEFKESHAINQHYVECPGEIDVDYKTYGVPLGVYTDDFSQQLCVNANFSEHPTDPNPFYRDLLLWEKGKYWVSGQLFDEGMQTRSQLAYYARKNDIKVHQEEMSGNGSLMRVLPIAFMASDIDTLNVMAYQCSYITHNSDECIKACQFYCLLARFIADQPGGVTPELFTTIWGLVGELLKWSPDPWQQEFGSGYVIDTLNIVKDCIEHSTSFKEAVTRAILYGGDTDTNACVVGGIAALVFGLADVPKEWMDFIEPSLRNRHVQELFQFTCEEHA